MSARLLVLALCASLAACAQSRTRGAAAEPDEGAQPVVAEPERHGMQAPLVVAWEEQELGDRSARLVARVEFRGALPGPVNVEVRTPSGARLASGESSLVLAPAEPGETVRLPYVVEFEAVPAEDLTISAGVQTPSFGVHAEAAYRFGRPEPTGPRPVRGGPELQIGNVKLGQPVIPDGDQPRQEIPGVKEPGAVDRER